MNWIPGVPPLKGLKDGEVIIVQTANDEHHFTAIFAGGCLNDTYSNEPFEHDDVTKWARIEDEPEPGPELPDELKRTFSNLMYAFTKEAARVSFVDFLETWEINDSDYEDIRKYLKDKYGVKTYV